MAKKKSAANSQPTSRSSRKRNVSHDVLLHAARLLQQQSTRLTSLADVMKDQKIAEVEIDGYGLLERGIDEMDRFLDNVNKGVNQAKRDKERSLL